MKTFTLMRGAVLVAGLTASSLVSAQGANALDVPAPAPDPTAPLSGSVVTEANPTFEFTNVSNATQYRLYVRNNDSGAIKRYRFTSTGTNVERNGVEVCPSATAAGTPCAFTPTDLNFADGTSFTWLIGARNQAAGQVSYKNSKRQTVTYQQFGFDADTLAAVDLYAPRGNLSGDDGMIRQFGAGVIAFHWGNDPDSGATRFVLKLATAVGNNTIPSITIPVADANCTTTPGLFDACQFDVDPSNFVDSSASDFCWTIVPQNGLQSTPEGINLANDSFACFATNTL